MAQIPRYRSQLFAFGLLLLDWICSVRTMHSSAIFILKDKGHCLKHSLIIERRTYSAIDCAHLCLSEYPVCKSMNYEMGDHFSSNHRHKCQLNNATKSSKSQDIIADETFNYFEPLQDLSYKERTDEGTERKDSAFMTNYHALETFFAIFTNLGASGRFGPTSIGSFYVGKDHENLVTVISGIQQWTVPFSGTYQVTAVGASGGHDRSGAAAKGRGAYMRGDFDLVKGEVIKILVGQQGAVNAGKTSSGGGGGTFVVTSANVPLIIAGGGGGIESITNLLGNCDASTGTSGQENECASSCDIWPGGVNGNGGLQADTSNSGGGGGGFYSNGRSSKQFGGAYGNGGEGGRSFLNGGAGGRSWYYNGEGGFGGGGGAYGNGGGAGGGGGYSGGASGNNNVDSCGGGGGSYNSGKNQHNTAGFQANGNGFVEITRVLPT